MDILEGDTVKVAYPYGLHSGLKGRTGKALFVSEDQQTCSVQLQWEAAEGSVWETQGVLSSFAAAELEVIDSHEIQQIAGALLREERNSHWTHEDAHEVAANLYRAGCRFDG